MGYRAPFVFALCLGTLHLLPFQRVLTLSYPVFVDLVLRLVLIEKHTALRWIKAGVDIPGFEAPGYTPASKSPLEESQLKVDKALLEVDFVSQDAGPPSVWKALLHMVTAPRPVTLFVLTGLQGFILGGLLDTGVGWRAANDVRKLTTCSSSQRWCFGFSSSTILIRWVRGSSL